MAHPGSSGPWEWWILGVAEPGCCGPKPNIRLWYLQYLFKCAQSSALLCLRPYVCALMSALLCLRSFVGALLTGHPWIDMSIRPLELAFDSLIQSSPPVCALHSPEQQLLDLLLLFILHMCLNIQSFLLISFCMIFSFSFIRLYKIVFLTFCVQPILSIFLQHFLFCIVLNFFINLVPLMTVTFQ